MNCPVHPDGQGFAYTCTWSIQFIEYFKLNFKVLLHEHNNSETMSIIGHCHNGIKNPNYIIMYLSVFVTASAPQETCLGYRGDVQLTAPHITNLDGCRQLCAATPGCLGFTFFIVEDCRLHTTCVNKTFVHGGATIYQVSSCRSIGVSLFILRGSHSFKLQLFMDNIL